MTTTRYKETEKKLLFKDIPPGDMFFCQNVFWTKHIGSFDGVTGATAFAGYTNPYSLTPSRTFANDEEVFTITKTVIE